MHMCSVTYRFSLEPNASAESDRYSDMCLVILRVHTSRSFTIALLMFGVSALCRRSAMEVSPRPKSLGAIASLPHGACAGAQRLRCTEDGLAWHRVGKVLL